MTSTTNTTVAAVQQKRSHRFYSDETCKRGSQQEQAQSDPCKEVAALPDGIPAYRNSQNPPTPIRYPINKTPVQRMTVRRSSMASAQQPDRQHTQRCQRH
jgi:hypothetical protein